MEISLKFPSFISDNVSVIESLLQPKAAQLPSHVQSVYMQSILKIFSAIVSSDSHPSPSPFSKNLISTDEEVEVTSTPTTTAAASNEHIEEIVKVLHSRLPLFSQSEYLEVQERVRIIGNA
jgi:hypothetical protein